MKSHNKIHLSRVASATFTGLFLCVSPVVAQTAADPADIRAKAKLEAAQERADAKLEAANERAKARIETADERAKAKIETAQERAQAKLDTADRRAETSREVSTMQSDARTEATDTRLAAKGAGRLPLGGMSMRSVDRFGAYASLWGDPYPTTLGVNVGYNITDFIRVTVGVGSDSVEGDRFRVDTIGLGTKFFVPGWSLSPTVGVNFANTSAGPAGPRTIRGFDPEGTRLYGNVGLDWQSGIGINLAAGWADSLAEGETGAFYLNAGFFL